VDSLLLYRKALEHKISIAPGVMFSPKEHYQNFIRLNCASRYSDQIDQALFTLGKLVAELSAV
jgi:DNA-binding transcriptional MocR family regulator